MSKWEYLVDAVGDEALRKLERAYNADSTSANMQRYVAALRRAGKTDEANNVESLWLLQDYVKDLRFNKPDIFELYALSDHYTPDQIRTMMQEETTPNRINVLKLTPGDTVYDNHNTNADGSSMRWRINGKRKFWKTRPEEFRIPLKYGLGRRREHNDYLTHHNVANFSLRGQ